MDHFCFYVLFCHACLSVHCSLVITCWERAGLLVFCMRCFFCVFVTFQCNLLGQVWYLIVSILDLCLLSYFVTSVCMACNVHMYKNMKLVYTWKTDCLWFIDDKKGYDFCGAW